MTDEHQEKLGSDVELWSALDEEFAQIKSDRENLRQNIFPVEKKHTVYLPVNIN